MPAFFAALFLAAGLPAAVFFAGVFFAGVFLAEAFFVEAAFAEAFRTAASVLLAGDLPLAGLLAWRFVLALLAAVFFFGADLVAFAAARAAA